MSTDALIPGPRRPARCEDCGRPIPKGPVIGGMGSSCARDHGLLPLRRPRMPKPVRDAADNQLSLLELLDYEESNSAEE